MSALPRLSTDRSAEMTNGVVHLGVGAFFRAHGAVYLSQLMKRHPLNWGVVGVSLRRPDQRDKLKPQGFAYTALELSGDDAKPQTINVISDILVAPENPRAVIDAMSDRDISLVTLTITEKGYCLKSAAQGLDFEHEDIVHDQQALDRPKSAIGFLVAALAKRKNLGLRPFTVLSCDNLPENGKLTRKLVVEFAKNIDKDLARWIETEGKFPCSMVDRIVPATTDADLAKIENLLGVHDASPVVHEPFCQWVVEDDFVDGVRPALEDVGVQLVDDVAPYETMKLRCLNGTHSALAYLGYLAGHETISAAVSDDQIKRFVQYLWTAEIVPAIAAPKTVDLDDYCAALMRRYENAAIQHRTWQIAMDGSQKLPQRLVATITTNLLESRSIDGLCLSVAAWMIYTRGQNLQGEPIEVKDPLVAQYQDIADRALNAPDTVAAYLNLREVFPTELAADPVFRATVLKHYNALASYGVAKAIDGVLE
jgi:fructuronate reductase